MNNETIDYTLICNDKQEIGTVIIGVSVIKSEFSLEIRGYFFKEYMGIFQGPSELSVLKRCPY